MTVHAFRRLATTVAVAAAVAAVGGCASRGAEHAPVDEHVSAGAKAHVAKDKLRHGDQVPFERSWDLKLPRPVHLSWISAEVPDLVFFQLEGGDNEIYAVDAMSGRTRWISQALPRPITLAPAVHRVVMPGQRADESTNDDRLYVVSDDVLFCFDAVYGQIVWRYQLPFSASSGPCAVGTDANLRVYLGDWAGRTEVIGYHPTKAYPYQLWQWNVYAPITAQPYARDGLVYVGDHHGAMHCFQLDRAQTWAQTLGTGITGAPITRGRALYVGTTDSVFYALNRLSGEVLGKVFLNAPIRRQPMLFTDEPTRVYVWVETRDHHPAGLYAIDTRAANIPLQDAGNKSKPTVEAECMTVAWFVPSASSLVSSTPDHLFVTAAGSATVQAINRVTGAIDWAWDVDESVPGKQRGHEVTHLTQYCDPTDLNRSIYTADDRGQVVAYRLFGYVPKDRVAATPAAH